MARRMIGTIGLAVAWSAVSLLGVAMGWILLGAAVIGMLGSVGMEPPRRSRRLRQVRFRVAGPSAPGPKELAVAMLQPR